MRPIHSSNTTRPLALFLALALFTAGALMGCTRQSGIGGRETGAVVGGVAGGVAGSQFGSGSGKTAATIAGVILGAAVGSYIGDYLTSQDRNQMGRAFETNRPGQPTQWRNPQTGYQHRVVPQQTYRNQQGRTCRNFNQVIMTGGQRETVQGTACKNNQGQWEIVQAR